MSNNEPSRLDRLEALAESILVGLQETRAIANSNAKSIQSLSGEWQKDRKQWEKDRKGIYQLLGHLTRSMSDFYNIQSDFYNRFDQIDERQANMTQILRELKGEQEKPGDTKDSV